MDLTLECIESYNIPWLSDLQIIISEIKENQNSAPDITIESCKALIEAVSKNIIADFTREEPETPLFDEDLREYQEKSNRLLKKIVEIDVVQLVGRAHNLLQPKVSDIDADLIRHLKAIVHRLATIRNDRCCISHGHIFPKPENSNMVLAKSISAIIDAHCSYLIHAFASIDFSYKEKVKYDDNQDFNIYLDELYEKIGFSYSKALYMMDYIQYVEILDNYKNMDAVEQKEGKPIKSQQDIVEHKELVDRAKEHTIGYLERIRVLQNQESDLLQSFCVSNNLHLESLKKLFEDLILIADERLELKDSTVVSLFIDAPKLHERKNAVTSLKHKILTLLEE